MIPVNRIRINNIKNIINKLNVSGVIAPGFNATNIYSTTNASKIKL